MNWSNPVIIGLLVFIAFLIVVIVGNTIAASVLGGKFKKRKTTSATTTTKSSGWFWKLVIIGVIGFGIFGVVRYFKTPKKAIVQTVITPKSITERKWKLRWKKLPTTPNGVNGNQREIRLDAVVMKYDRFEFKIVVFYKEQGQEKIHDKKSKFEWIETSAKSIRSKAFTGIASFPSESISISRLLNTFFTLFEPF